MGASRLQLRARLGVAVGMTALSVGSPVQPQALGQEDQPAVSQREIVVYDANATGSVVHFDFHAPEAFLPLKVEGGIIESNSAATSSPRGFGFAGIAPVPVATSLGSILIPKKDPITESDVPPEIEQAVDSFDFSALPTSCQAYFPSSNEDGSPDEVNCGGPNQDNSALAFTAAAFNGYSTSDGDIEDPFATRTLSRARVADLHIPGLQATFRNASTDALARVNPNGLPQADATAQAERVALFGSLVILQGLSSATSVATDGTEAGTAVRSSLTVQSASVAGIPVMIGPEGMKVHTQEVPGTEVDELAARLETVLAQTGGLSIRLLPAPPAVREGSQVRAESASLQIAYSVTDPTPVDVLYRIGFTRGVVNAISVESSAADAPVPQVHDEGGLPDPGRQNVTDISVVPDRPATAAPTEIDASRTTASTESLQDMPKGPTLPLDDFDAGTPWEREVSPGRGEDSRPVPWEDATGPLPDVAASTEVAAGATRLLAPNLSSAPPDDLATDGLRGTYAAFGGLAMGSLVIIILRRSAWLQPKLRTTGTG